MIDQDLIDRCEALLRESPELDDLISFSHDICRNMAELLDNHKKLIESNAELHKEFAKLRGGSE